MAGAPNAMEYTEHERTFGRFIRMTKVGVMLAITLVVCLALVGFGGGGGKIVGGLMVLVSLVAAAVDLGRGTEMPKASVGAFLLTGVLALLFV